MAGKAVVRWPSPVLARISRFRPMSPASQVRLEAYRFESCRERFCVCVCVCVCVDTLGSRGYFFLMDTDGSRRSRVNEAQSTEEKKIT